MSIITSQQIFQYYEAYSKIEVTFTKEVIQATQLIPKNVFLKCLGYQYPCILYSSSMVGAKIILNSSMVVQESLRKANNMVYLRYCFQKNPKGDPITFFIPCKVTGSSPYNKEGSDLYFYSLAFTQRPPDTLIEILGTLLDATRASQKRREERILITEETLRKIGISTKELSILVQGVPRKGILRDLSFGGAKVILLGLAKFLMNKEVVLRLEIEEPRQVLNLPGTIIRYEPVEGRKDIAAFAIKFHENKVPITYKMLLSDYLKQQEKRKEIPTL
ncbi:MAG: PilZ domain-containing protein [Spirochaetales bacterium]